MEHQALMPNRFSLTSAPSRETEMRPDETLQVEFRIDIERTLSDANKAACICCCLLSPWTIFCCLPQLCVIVPHYRRAKAYGNAKFFVTNQAVHLHTGPEDRNFSTCSCDPIGTHCRIPFEKIRAVNLAPQGLVCCQPSSREGYGFLQVCTTDAVAVVTRHSDGHHSTHVEDPNEIRLSHAFQSESVAKLLIFLRDSVQAGKAIDWDQVKREMKGVSGADTNDPTSMYL